VTGLSALPTFSTRANTSASLTRAPQRGVAQGRVLARQCSCGNHSPAGRECDECRRARGPLLRQATGESTPTAVPSIVHDALRTTGRPLDAEVRGIMQPRFGRDLGDVRIHTDALAAESASAVQARAYTIGHDIFLAHHEYAPHTATGQRLLAHELAHTIQQSAASSSALLTIGPIGSDAERQADAAAADVVSGGQARLSAGSQTLVQRTPFDPMARGAGRGRTTVPFKEATELSECTRIMGPENLEYCQRAALGETTHDAPLPVRASRLAGDLTTMIAGATWKEIRKRAYPKASAAGIKRAKDRKTGALPDLTGLGRVSSLEHFAGLVRAAQHTWDARNPDANVKKLGDAAKAELTAADVPPFLVVNKQPMDFKGFFLPSFWSFTVSEALVSGSTLSDEDAAEVANVTLHESRHAEQQFLAARFAAGRGDDAATIKSQQTIPLPIAQAAISKKFDATTDPKVAALGSAMFSATVTNRATNQAISDDDGIDDLKVRKAEAEAALATLNRRVTQTSFDNAVAKRDALRFQIIYVETHYPLYRAIPYEADAHEVGDAAEQAFRGWP
jgi:hypothetical protein